MAIKFSNNATTTLSASLNAVATTATVADGSVFPALGGSDHCYVTINGASGTEIVKVTAIATNTLTIVRAQDGTSALAFVSGDKVELRLVTAALNDLSNEHDSLAEMSGDLDDITDGATYVKMSATEQAKLSGIEASADVTDATNVAAAGALMTTGGTMTGNVSFGDNDKAIFGAGSDLQIYHDGTTNKIVGSIDVTGTVTADGLTVEDTQASGGVGIDIINVGDGGVSTTPYTYIASKLNPSRDGGEIRFTRASSYGSEATADSNIELYTATDSVNKLVFKAHSGGDISFYEDEGITPKLVWKAGDESLGIGGGETQYQFGILNAGNASAILRDTSDSSRGLRLRSGTAGNPALIDTNSASKLLALGVNGAEAMRIDSSGNVGIGEASPERALHVKSSDLVQALIESTGTSARLTFQASGSGSNAHNLIAVDGNDMWFRTNNAERMRIDSNGNIYGNGSNFIRSDPTYADGSNNWQLRPEGVIQLSHTGTAEFSVATFANGNGVVGTIRTSGTSTAYNTSSDYRLKEDWQPMTGAIARLNQLNPVNFAWKADGSRVDGFLAHEAGEVVPECCSGEKDAMRTEEYEVTPAEIDDEGNVVTEAVMGTREVPDYQGIDQSKLVPLLTAALQEAVAKIESLETRIAALESN